MMFLQKLQIIRRKSIWANVRGTSVIEFAVIAPAVLMMTFAAIEFGMILYLRSGVEAVTHDAARLAITGSGLTSNNKRDAYIKGYLKKELDQIVIVKQGYEISSQVFTTLGGVAPIGGGAAPPLSTGSANDIVRYTVTMNYQYITPLAQLIGVTVGSAKIQSTVFVKNEAY